LSVETEAKFMVPDEETFTRLQAIEQLGPYVRRPGMIKKIRDRYVDTDARSFYSRQFAARLRENLSSGELLLTLKRMGPQAQETIHTRNEYEIGVPSPDIADWPEGDVRLLAEEIAGSQPLSDLVTVDQTRTVSYLYQGDRRVAEMSLDEVAIQTSNKPAWSYELEVEMLSEGDISDLRVIAHVLAEEYGLAPQPLSKFERALALSYPELL
jgi:inorganic triphosphatase YgiF